MAELNGANLPAKLYFRIGEVAELVGVEPHVLRYWEREFRVIRPTKSARGQRVYSRRDVENLMRVRELLYEQGFTIAGAKKRLSRPDVAPEPPTPEPPPGMDGGGLTHEAALGVSTYRPLKRGAPSVSGSAVVDREPTASPPTQVAREPAGLQSEPIDATRLGGDPIAGPAPAVEAQPPDRYAPERSRTREQLLAMRDEIAAFLAELERSVR